MKPRDGLGGFGAASEAAKNGVEVVGRRRVDLAKDSVSVREVVERREGIEFNELGAVRAELELKMCSGYEMSLELLDLMRTNAFLQQSVEVGVGHSIVSSE